MSNKLRKRGINILKIAIGFYVMLCVAVYLFQEKIIFFPEKLPADYIFQFDKDFEEFNIKTNDDKRINALLFKADSAKGLIFYLHGNAGSLKSWGYSAPTYAAFGYDVIMLDYRGYGKSEGSITSQEQLFSDNQMVYNHFKKRYGEESIVILGYSIGSGMAAKLASENHPGKLILQAPYYNMKELLHTHYPIFPAFLLRYTFDTNEYLKDTNMPIIIFHGNKDNIIPIKSSIKLKDDFTDKIQLYAFKDLGHHGFINSKEYNKALKNVLAQNVD